MTLYFPPCPHGLDLRIYPVCYLCNPREDEAVVRYMTRVQEAVDRYFAGPHEDWRTVAADMAQILMDAADERSA